MPHRASAKKAMRKNEKRRGRNRSVKSRLTTETRKFERALERGDAGEAATHLNLLSKLLHKASAKGVLHANTASRRLARLQKHLNDLSAKQTTA